MSTSISQIALAVLLLTVLGGLSCATLQSSAAEVNLVDLQQLVWDGHHSTMWTGTFYCGTKDDFHYFRHTMQTQQDRLVKIKASGLDVPNPGEFPLPRAQWVDVSALGIQGSRQGSTGG